jgi:hypothetical protein
MEFIAIEGGFVSPKNLFSDLEQARLLLPAIKVCDTELSGVFDRAQETEPPDELLKIRRAVGENHR